MTESGSSTETNQADAPVEVFYELSAFDLPKLSEDGQSSDLGKDAYFATFQTLDAALAAFADSGPKFERVHLVEMSRSEGKTTQKLLKRFHDKVEQNAEDITRR